MTAEPEVLDEPASRARTGKESGQRELKLQVCINKDGELVSSFAEKRLSLSWLWDRAPCGAQGQCCVGSREQEVQVVAPVQCGRNQRISRLPPGSAPKPINSPPPNCSFNTRIDLPPQGTCGSFQALMLFSSLPHRYPRLQENGVPAPRSKEVL